MASLLSRCLKQLLAQMEPLRENGTFREIAVRQSAVHDATPTPAIHIVPGDEAVGATPDFCGYTVTRQLLFKIVFSDYRDPYFLAAELVCAAQAAIESDESLNGLAMGLEYKGEQPFITDATQPAGGTFLIYELNYRRKRGNPAVQY